MKRFIRLFIYFFPVTLAAQDTLRLSLLFTGDIMQHDSQIAAAWVTDSSRYDYRVCFQQVKPILSASDLTIGNLEFTLGGPPYKGYPQFSAPDQILTALKDAGYDILVTANNHCLDRGKKGLERTLDLLDEADFLHTGTFKDTLEWLNLYPLVVASKGFRLSLLNYTYGTNGIRVSKPNIVNYIDTARIHHDLNRAKDQATDATVVFIHWGKEYERYPDASQRKLAEFCFRNGAKLVIGAHPHVLQSMEWKKEADQLVVYSLGNFVSAQRDRYKNGGAMVHVDLEKIIRPDSTVSTRISNAAYSLVWVHRETDARRSYVIIPVKKFEADSTLITGPKTRASAREFIDDSRKLYGAENKNVLERTMAEPREY